MHVMCTTCMPGPAEVRRFPAPRMRVTDGGELPSGCWEQNSGSLQEQVLLTMSSSLQHKATILTQQPKYSEKMLSAFLFVKTP